MGSVIYEIIALEIEVVILTHAILKSTWFGPLSLTPARPPQLII
jgi:hypothetical protein